MPDKYKNLSNADFQSRMLIWFPLYPTVPHTPLM